MSKQPQKREDMDNTLEDAFGVNFRALKTLKDILVRPKTVFASYAAKDRTTYTPALRLFAGLIALQVFVSFLWGGYSGLLITQWESQPATASQMESLFQGSVEEIAGHYGNAAAFLHAIVVGAFTALSAFLIGAFNKSLGWVARVNITFAILTAGSIIGLLGLIVLAIIGEPAILNWMPLVIFLSYWLFFVRGGTGILATTLPGSLIKGSVFATVTMIYVLIGGVVMAFMGLTYAYIRINVGG